MTRPALLAIKRPSGGTDLVSRADRDMDLAARSLTMALESIGWTLTSIEIDIGAETARIELRRGERVVTFDARNGAATITREDILSHQVKVGRKGDVTVVDRFAPMFLGRDRCPGLRSGLKALSHYVADNAPVAISREAARNLFRPLLVGRTASEVKS